MAFTSCRDRGSNLLYPRWGAITLTTQLIRLARVIFILVLLQNRGNYLWMQRFLFKRPPQKLFLHFLTTRGWTGGAKELKRTNLFSPGQEWSTSQMKFGHKNGKRPWTDVSDSLFKARTFLYTMYVDIFVYILKKCNHFKISSAVVVVG